MFVFEDARNFWDFCDENLRLFILEIFKFWNNRAIFTSKFVIFNQATTTEEVSVSKTTTKQTRIEGKAKEFKNRKTITNFYFNLMNSKQWRNEELDFLRFASNGIKNPKTVVDGGRKEVEIKFCVLFCHSVNFIQLSDFNFFFMFVAWNSINFPPFYVVLELTQWNWKTFARCLAFVNAF